MAESWGWLMACLAGASCSPVCHMLWWCALGRARVRNDISPYLVLWLQHKAEICSILQLIPSHVSAGLQLSRHNMPVRHHNKPTFFKHPSLQHSHFTRRPQSTNQITQRGSFLYLPLNTFYRTREMRGNQNIFNCHFLKYICKTRRKWRSIEECLVLVFLKSWNK